MSHAFSAIVALLVATIVSTGFAGLAHSADAISVSWRLIGNRPDGGYEAELKLYNDSEEAFDGEWSLYFNSASKLLPESVPAEFMLRHINGDFYVLRPGAGFQPILPGKSRIIAYEGAPWAISISDAPSGFYLVRDEQSSRSAKATIAQKVLPLRIEPFPAPEEMQRGATDIVSVATPKSRYLKNESLELLQPERLGNIVPTPIHIEPLPGQVRLHNATTIFYEPQLANEATFLAEALRPLLGASIKIEPSSLPRPPSPDSIRLRIGQVDLRRAQKLSRAEAYILDARPDQGIEIIGSGPAGVFYGVQTLRALLPIEAYRSRITELTIDAVRIVDSPRFGYRGLHLDVARNFQNNETVKKLLELMAFYKLNRFHWHLTDDEGWRVEIKRLPELTETGARRGHTLDEANHLVPSHGSGPDPDAASSAGSGFYSQENFIEILRFANARHISVIPEFDFPGHARAAVKAMEARYRRLLDSDWKAAGEFLLREPGDASRYESVQMWRDNVVDVGRDETYRFLTVVIDEVVDMYRRAEVPLDSIHIGGDEVPKGAWEYSSACRRIPTNENSEIPRSGQLELYFLNRVSEILRGRSVQPAFWDDCLLLEVQENSAAANARRVAGKAVPTAYVWNNVWGWGREDAAYRLANAGFDVVLCNATHLYFDLATEKHSDEPGYYWAGFVDERAPFEFVPLDIFKNARRNAMGQPVTAKSLAGRIRLTPDGARHIRGIQGQLWGENLRSAESVEYMAFPRTIALAERAWAAQPAWAEIDNPQEFERQLAQHWNRFANQLGQRELPRLDYFNGGVHYRLPPPGAVVRGGLLHANVAFPGLEIRFTDDGTVPTSLSDLYTRPITSMSQIKMKSFDSRGRGSRTVTVQAAD